MDLMREAVGQSDRARRAEAEVDRLHRWIEHGCHWPPPERPQWAPRTPYRQETSHV